eukprot:7238025-Prorocentrum_lima.AAC.1
MQKNLENVKTTRICKKTMAMTMRTKKMAVGTIMAMHQEKEIMEAKHNLSMKMMWNILIQARPCRF